MTMHKTIQNLIGQDIQLLLRAGGVQIAGKLVVVDDDTCDVSFEAQQQDGLPTTIISTVIIGEIAAVHRQAKKPSLVVM